MKAENILLAMCLMTSLASSQGKLGSKLLEKGRKLKAAQYGSIEGDVGRVIVYSDPERTNKITELTGGNRTYCTGIPHPKSIKQAESSTRVRYGLWSGTECEFSSTSSTNACGDFQTNGANLETTWDQVEKYDFEIDLVVAFEHEIKNGETGVKDMFIILDGGTNNKIRFAMSHPIKIDLAGSADAIKKAEIEKNKDMKLAEGVFVDLPLISRVTTLLEKLGMTKVEGLAFTSNWEVVYESNKPKIRGCKANCKALDNLGNCKHYYFTVWETYDGTGSFQLPSNANEDLNSFSIRLVPC
jgi:hypothetical protein